MGVEMPLAFCHSMIGMPGRECDVMIQEFYGAGLRHRRLQRITSTAMPRACSTPACR